jgi:protein TonB
VRWDSPFVLASAGAVAMHVIVIVVLDAIAVTHPLRLDPPAPHVTLVEVTIHHPPKPVPAPVPVPMPASPAAPPAARISQVAATTPGHAEPLPALAIPAPTPALAGDDGPVVAMDDLGPASTGIAVANHAGSGTGTASGTVTASGTGSGSGGGPVSIAAIKTRALPRGDYSYYESKDYPAEAKRLGIEGTLRVRLVVDATGHVASALLLDHLGHGLDELALARARAIEFTPARDTEAREVSSVVIWTFQMTLPR